MKPFGKPETPPPVKLNNLAREVGSRRDRDWYEWLVYVDEDDDVIETIREVEYLLHPSFTDPLRVVDERVPLFALRGSGWGEFDVQVTVFFKNGDRAHFTYEMDFDNPWDAEVVDAVSTDEVGAP